jgi:hypothetical protein
MNTGMIKVRGTGNSTSLPRFLGRKGRKTQNRVNREAATLRIEDNLEYGAV